MAARISPRFGTEDIELRQDFELQSESQGLVYVYRHKIFLQNLHPDNTTTTTSAFCYGSEGAPRHLVGPT